MIMSISLGTKLKFIVIAGCWDCSCCAGSIVESGEVSSGTVVPVGSVGSVVAVVVEACLVL